jgi:hypothetical protein
MPSDGLYRQRFGSWGKALELAELEVKKPIISPQCREATREARIGKRSYAWKGGIIRDRVGYIHIWNPDHPNASKTGRGSYRGGKGGYVLAHRLIMADYLGRPLGKNESVHHINGIKDDNRIENLELMQKRVHHGYVVCPHCGKGFRIR